jgi:general secretion pathway protein D
MVFLPLACAHQEEPPPPLEERLRMRIIRMYSKSSPPQAAPNLAEQTPAQIPPRDKAAFSRLTPLRRLAGPGARPTVQQLGFGETEIVNVAVDEMPLSDFIHYVFADILQVNYVVDSQVEKSRKPITLNLNQTISKQQLFEVVANVLKQHGLSVHIKDDTFYIWKAGPAQDVAIGIGATAADIPTTFGDIQQIIPIKYMDAQNLLSFVPQSAGIKAVAALRENVLVVTGSRDQVEQVISVVNMLDRPAMRGWFVGMLRLQYWNPADMAQELTEILTQEGIPVAKMTGQKGVYMNQLDRLESLLIFAAEKEWLERVRYWAKILDVPVARAQRQFFLYFPDNSKATELGDSLNKIFGVAMDGSGEGRGDATGMRGSRTVWSGAPAASPGSNRSPDAPQTGAAAGSPGEAPAGRQAPSAETDIIPGLPMIGGDVKIAVDENRNALIIYATPEEYNMIKSLMQRLDVMPGQVLIQATFAEVTLKDTLQYGLEWFLEQEIGDVTTTLSTLGGLGLGNAGLAGTLISDSAKFQMIFNMLMQEDLVKILQSPRVTVRDGKSAYFMVGQEVPIIMSEATSADLVVEGTTGIVRSIQYRNTGVTLNVTPSIHTKGVVTLEIAQEVSEAQTNTVSDIDSPLILNRNITTEVVTGDGQTVLLGGLIRENASESVNSVPFLGSIPILGFLFKTTSKNIDRTELVVLVTPRIIKNTQDIDEMRDAIFDSFVDLEMKDVLIESFRPSRKRGRDRF